MLNVYYRPELLLGAWLMAMYSSFVAFEVTLRMRSTDHGAARGWWLGGALSVGTGLWATQVLGLLSARVQAGSGYNFGSAFLSWTLAVLAAGAIVGFAGPVRLSSRGGARVAGGAVIGLLLCGVFWSAVMATHFEMPVAWHLGWSACAVGVAVLSSIGFVTALSQGRAQSMRGRHRGAWIAVSSAILVGQLHFGVSASGIADREVEGAVSTFLGEGLALLAGISACVVLTMTRLMAALETRLTGKTEKLADSLRKANTELKKIAYRDPLTKLPNRLVFEERLAGAIRRADREGKRLALLFIDLDGFKPINDSFGHNSGDIVLRGVGDRLRVLARQGDTMARVGGDEFLMLLEGTPDEGSVAMVAQRVLSTLSQPYDIGDREVSMSCSIGIVFYPDGGAQSKLIAHADAAMYAAKRAGGSTYCFFEARMDADAREQVELLRDLRLALEHNQLELYYQPKVEAKSRQVTAAEALLRWHHPVRGLILPSVFIPVAERFGLIGALGNWVIEDACRQARQWREQGLAMRVAINLSVHQMRQDDLVERIQSALRRNRIEPNVLTCEITESVAMEDTRASQTTFQRLGRAGVHLSIDDFGTGYSSLSYLRQLPAEELKIDRSFIMDLESSVDARAIVDAVVRLAHALGLKVVAEGVDNPRQCEILMKLGCDELQGFLFARPMSAKALLEWATDDDTSASDFRPSLFVEGENEGAATIH